MLRPADKATFHRKSVLRTLAENAGAVVLYLPAIFARLESHREILGLAET